MGPGCPRVLRRSDPCVAVRIVIRRFRRWRELRANPEWRRGRKGLLTGHPDGWTPEEWRGWKARQRAHVRMSSWDMSPWNHPNYVQGQGLHVRKLCWCPEYGGQQWDDANNRWVCKACGKRVDLGSRLPHVPGPSHVDVIW